MKKKMTFVVIITVVILGCIEAGFRLKGFKPYVFKPRSWQVEPKFFLVSDSLLGYRLDTGTFTFTIDGQQTKATHTANRQRVTAANTIDSQSFSDCRVNFLGGTNIYGMGMNDEETLPYIFQQMYSNVKVNNFAVPEYGIASNYVLLSQCTDIKKGDVFICIYFSAHDARPPRKLLKASYADVVTGQIVPFPTLSIDDKLQTRLNDYTYKPWFGDEYSAAINFFEDYYNAYHDKHNKGHQYAQKVIQQIHENCKSKGATFVLVGRRNDTLTKQMVDYCIANQIKAIYLPMAGKSLGTGTIDKNQDKRKFSAKLMEYLHEQNIVDSLVASQSNLPATP